jgi:hypothetical protein
MKQKEREEKNSQSTRGVEVRGLLLEVTAGSDVLNLGTEERFDEGRELSREGR